MKIEFPAEGTLQIRPESPIEDFALRHWFADFKDDKARLEVSMRNLNSTSTGTFTHHVIKWDNNL